MSSLAIGMMVGVCALVWGGFLILLVRAIRHEGEKGREPEAAAPRA
jgi:hypothetical protein